MAKIYLEADETYIAAGAGKIFGSTGDESVTVQSGVTGVVMDSAVEGATFAGNLADYTFAQDGIALSVYKAGVLVTTFNSPDQTPTFADGAVDIVYSAGTMTLGSTELVDGADPVVVSGGTGGDISVTLSTIADQPENTEVAAGTTIATATSDSTEAVTWSLIGDDADKYSIDPTTGAITVATAYTPDFETDSSYNFTVVAKTADGKTGSAAAVVDVEDVANEGQTFRLTTKGSDHLTGGAGDDTVTGNNSSIITEGTLQATDKIDGGAGSDTADLTLSGAWTGFTTGSMKNVETVDLTNDTTAAFNFSAKGITGATKYSIDATKASITLSDLAKLADIEVSGPAKAGNITVDYATTSDVWTGSQTDTQNLKVTNVGTANTKTDGTDNAKVGTVSIAKVEALDITTAGTANTLDLSSVADAKAITVTGAGTTQINAVGAATTSFDASTATGKVIVDTSGAAAGALTSIKTGAGDDTITASATDLKINGTVAGSTGADKLVLDATAGDTLALNMSGVQTLDVKTTSALTFSGSNVTDLATVNLIGNAGGVSFLNMAATPLTVNTSGDSAAAAIGFDTAAAVTYNMDATAAQTTAGTTAATATAAATFSGATALTVNANALVASSGAITANEATSLTINNASNVVNAAELNQFSSKVTANKATSVTVDSKGTLATTAEIVADKATTMTLNTGSTAVDPDVLKIDATKLNTLNVTAKQDLAITESTSGTTSDSLDSVQTLTVTTDKAFSFAGDYLDDLASATISGTTAKSSADLQALGASTLTHNVNVTATGLKAGLKIGNVNAGTASSTIDFSGVTGDVELTSTGTVNADSGVTITGTNVAGNVTGTAAISSNGNISVDVTNAAKAVTLGTLNAGTTGDVTVSANNIGGKLTVGAITGNNVTVNTKTSGAQVSESGVTAKTSVNWTASDLFDDDVAIATDATSTAFTATLNGGAKNDVFTIAGKAAQSSITVSGDLGAGTNKVTTTLADSSSSTGQTVSYSGLTSTATAGDATAETETTISAAVTGSDKVSITGSAKDDHITLNATASTTYSQAITVTDSTTTDNDVFAIGAKDSQVYTNLNLTNVESLTHAAAVSINASAISGDTMSTLGDTLLTLTDTAGDDTIDLTNVSGYKNGTTATTTTELKVTATTGNDIIKGLHVGGATYDGGAGNDTITVSTGVNTIVTGAGTDTVETTGGTNTVTATNTAGETTTIKATATGTTVNMTGAADATVDASTSTAALAINGTDGQKDTIIGGAGDDHITGGTGADTLTGGAGVDTFKFVAGDTGKPTASNFDTITDFTANASNKIDLGTTKASIVTNTTASSGTAAISDAGVATFHSDDNTLAKHIAAVEAGINAGGNAAAGQSAMWQEGSDAYLFISDGTDGVDAQDVLIKLTGLDTTDSDFDTLTASDNTFTIV